jgi:hypothetical protein
LVPSTLESAGVEFTDENGGGVGVRLRKRTRSKPAEIRLLVSDVGYRIRVSAIEGAGIQFIDEMAEG